MAIPGQTQGTYNYNTLVRTNDGNAFEFNTNATVLFVDELPSGVTINASFDSPSNPQILLREKVQLRFKATNRIIFTPSASTAGTIRIFLFFDESNPDEFDMSFFSTEVVGTSDTNITQINSETAPAVDMAGHFDVTNWEDYGGTTTVAPAITTQKINSKGTYRGSAGTTTFYTVPSGQTGYIWYFKHQRSQAGGGVSTARINVSGGTSAIDLSTLRAGDQQTTTSFNAPIRISENDTLQLITDASFDSVFVVYVYQPDGF
jgi:hypothetical protein